MWALASEHLQKTASLSCLLQAAEVDPPRYSFDHLCSLLFFTCPYWVNQYCGFWVSTYFTVMARFYSLYSRTCQIRELLAGVAAVHVPQNVTIWTDMPCKNYHVELRLRFLQGRLSYLSPKHGHSGQQDCHHPQVNGTVGSICKTQRFRAPPLKQRHRHHAYNMWQTATCGTTRLLQAIWSIDENWSSNLHWEP